MRDDDDNKLFHYTNLNAAIAILESGVLKPSNVDRLNDIFDWYDKQPLLVDLSTDESKNLFIDEIAKNAYYSKNVISKATLELSPTRATRKAKIKALRKERKKLTFSQLREDVCQRIGTKKYHIISPKFVSDPRMSFISFTKIKPYRYEDSILLWAHYGDGMRGCAFEFDVTRIVDKYLYPVDYNTTRPNLLSVEEASSLAKAATYAHKKLQEKYLDSILKIIYCRKHSAYRYEQEIRHLTPFYYFHSLNGNEYLPIQLKAIHIGVKVKKEQIVKIQKLVQEKYPNVCIKTYQCSENCYEIEEFFLPVTT